LSQTQTKFEQLAQRLSVWQGYCLILFAICTPVSITFSWIVLITGIILWISISILEWKASDSGKPLEKRLPAILGVSGAPLLLPLAVFALAVFLSGFFVGFNNSSSPGFQNGLHVAFKSLFSLQTFLVYPWAHQALQRAPRAKPAVLGMLFLIGSLSSLYAIVEPPLQKFFGDLIIHPPADAILASLTSTCYPVVKWLAGPALKFQQASGFLEQPMAFAGQLQVFLMLALALLLGGGYKELPRFLQKKQAIIGVIVCLIIGLVLASERSAWLGAIFGVLLLASRISIKVVVTAVLSLALVAGLSFAFIPFVKDRITMPFQGNDQSVKARVEIYKHAIEVFKASPVYGCGVKGFPLLGSDAAMPDKGYFDHAHSNYLHILATTGLIGFAAYIFMLAAIFNATFSSSKLKNSDVSAGTDGQQEKFNRALALGLLAATAALCVSGLFEYNFGTGHVRLTYFFALAFLAANLKLDVAQKNSDQSRLSQANCGEPIM